jgi:DNA-binding NarL/FixJ family response regulator
MTNLDQVKVTTRDQQVLNLLAQGCSNKEIGSELNISHRTVNITCTHSFLAPESSVDVNV